MTRSPRTSVIMPVHNSSRTLAQAVESVLTQTDGDLELLITDDGSSDGSTALLESYLDLDDRVRLFRHATSRGAAAARNTSITNAGGRFIAFLDSDDLWLPRKLSQQLPFMTARNAALGFTAYQKVSSEYGGDSVSWSSGARAINVPEVATYSSLSRHAFIGCLTAVYDRTIVGTMSMPEIRMRQDYGLWLQILRTHDRAVGLDEPLALYRSGSASSLSGNKLKTIRYTWNVHRQLEGHSRPRAATNVVSHLLHATRKRLI